MSTVKIVTAVSPAKQIKYLSLAGRHREAIALATELLANPTVLPQDVLPKVNSSLTMALLRAKQLDEVKPHAIKTAQDFQDNAFCQNNLTQVLLARGELDEAKNLGCVLLSSFLQIRSLMFY